MCEKITDKSARLWGVKHPLSWHFCRWCRREARRALAPASARTTRLDTVLDGGDPGRTLGSEAMTSPRPPVLEKGAHSAPTNTMLSRSSAWTESAWRPRAAGARGAAARAARLKEGRTARRPTADAVDPAASALADMWRGMCVRERSAWGNDGISERKSFFFSTAKRHRFDIWHRIANDFRDSERSLFRQIRRAPSKQPRDFFFRGPREWANSP